MRIRLTAPTSPACPPPCRPGVSWTAGRSPCPTLTRWGPLMPPVSGWRVVPLPACSRTCSCTGEPCFLSPWQGLCGPAFVRARSRPPLSRPLCSPDSPPAVKLHPEVTGSFKVVVVKDTSGGK